MVVSLSPSPSLNLSLLLSFAASHSLLRHAVGMSFFLQQAQAQTQAQTQAIRGRNGSTLPLASTQ